MSTRTLERRFRAETGDTVQNWIAQRRVEYARGLLEDSDMTISQIAYTVGFGSTESLRRHFSTATGTSARQYRQTFSVKPDSATGIINAPDYRQDPGDAADDGITRV
jgi:transcriptional regulator GlxA family with amidase domain